MPWLYFSRELPLDVLRWNVLRCHRKDPIFAPAASCNYDIWLCRTNGVYKKASPIFNPFRRTFFCIQNLQLRMLSYNFLYPSKSFALLQQINRRCVGIPHQRIYSTRFFPCVNSCLKNWILLKIVLKAFWPIVCVESPWKKPELPMSVQQELKFWHGSRSTLVTDQQFIHNWITSGTKIMEYSPKQRGCV